MLNTPKSVPRLSYTRSQSNLFVKSIMTQPRAKHMSLQKTEKINYNMILNKMLSIENEQKFMSFASKFVNRSILQCKQQPNRHYQTKDISNYLISDGKFVTKLAQMSADPLLVLNHFRRHIKTNKRMFKELHDKINKSKQEIQQDQYIQKQQKQHNRFNNETQEERNNRLNGYSKPQQINEGAKQTKIDFSEYIKSNRKSMQIYQRIKKLTESQECASMSKTNKKQQLKRQSLQVTNQKQGFMQQLTLSLIQELPMIEQQIIQYFPSLKYIIKRDKTKLQSYHKLEKIGIYKGYQISKVAIQINQWNGNHTDFNYQQNQTIIEHAVTISLVQQENQQVKQVYQNQIKGDQFLRIFLSN